MSGAAPWKRVGHAMAAGALTSAMLPSLLLLVFGIFQSPAIGLTLGLIAFITALPVALAHMLLFALPLYAALRPRLRLTRFRAALAGFAIGAVPILFYYYLPFGTRIERDTLTEAIAQWLYAGAALGLPGAVGGWVFAHILLRLQEEMDE